MCIVSLLHGKEAVDCKPPNAENQGHLGLRLQQTPHPCKNTSKLPSSRGGGMWARSTVIRSVNMRTHVNSLSFPKCSSESADALILSARTRVCV